MAKQPKIRFKGFTEEWKEKKISDLLLERIDMAPQNDAYPLMAFVANKGIVSKGDRYDRSALIKDAVNKPYKRTSYGDFIYSSNNLEAGSIGMNFYGNASISPVYSIFAPKGDNNPYYLGVRLAMPDVIHEMVRCRQGVVYGQWKIHEDEFLNISVKMPKPDEQKAISQVIIDLTTTISQREKELEKLKNIKRALLERMFPQNGQNTPAIRFKGFTDEWKEKKFGELYNRAIEKNDLSFGPDRIISVANMYFRPDTSDSSEEYMRTYNIMRIGDIAYEGNKSGNYAYGRWVENYIGDGIVSHVFEVLRPKVEYDLMYWRYAINNENTMRHILLKCTKKATMMTNIVIGEFLKQSILVPHINEQKKIGNFLAKLDSMLSLRERQLTLLKHTKQALLEQMFVNE